MRVPWKAMVMYPYQEAAGEHWLHCQCLLGKSDRSSKCIHNVILHYKFNVFIAEHAEVYFRYALIYLKGFRHVSPFPSFIQIVHIKSLQSFLICFIPQTLHHFCCPSLNPFYCIIIFLQVKLSGTGHSILWTYSFMSIVMQHNSWILLHEKVEILPPAVDPLMMCTRILFAFPTTWPQCSSWFDN